MRRLPEAIRYPDAHKRQAPGVVFDFAPVGETGVWAFVQDRPELEISRMSSMDKPPLDRWRFDEAVEPSRPIWGLPAIAKVLGLSISKTRKLAKQPEVPIYLPPGCSQYLAYKSELLAWVRAGKAQD